MQFPRFSQTLPRSAGALAALALLAIAGYAADVLRHKYVPAATGTTVRVEGTSTLHNWDMEAAKIDGSLEFSLGDLQAGAWSAGLAPTAEARFKSENLKNKEHGAAMEKLAYKALKTGEFAEVTYHLIEAGAPKAAGAGKWTMPTRGELTIAGVKREVKTDLTVTLDGTALVINGKLPIKMTDYGMKPPTAMLGMIKSGDAVTVIITWRLEPAP